MIKEVFNRLELKSLVVPMLAALIWMSLFLIFVYLGYPPLPVKLLYRGASMLVAIGHSSFIGLCATLFLMQRISKEQWVQAISITQGYFLYDTICIILFPSTSSSSQESLFFLLHHIVLLLILLFIREHARDIAIGLLSEIALPSLYFFWILQKMEAYDSPFYYPMAGIALLSYFIFRVCGLSYLFFSRVRIKENGMHRKIVSLFPILLLNYYWFYLIVKKATEVFINE